MKHATPMKVFSSLFVGLGLALGLSTAHAANAQHGAALVQEKACASCHGEGLNQPIAPNYPKLAGQFEDYVYQALRQYSPRFANNDLVGRKNAVMQGMVTGLTDKDMQDIAAFVASLPGDLRVKK